jgi:hypothetical protein
MRRYHQPNLKSIIKTQELGKELDKKEPDLFEKMINETVKKSVSCFIHQAQLPSPKGPS